VTFSSIKVVLAIAMVMLMLTAATQWCLVTWNKIVFIRDFSFLTVEANGYSLCIESPFDKVAMLSLWKSMRPRRILVTITEGEILYMYTNETLKYI